jgi:superfamily II DNA/RNA helicase
MPFAALGLSPALQRAVRAQGYTQPTPIQDLAIPAILQGSDVLATAQTGSGKTAAFALGLLQRLELAPLEVTRRPQALVLVPTRELCAQVAEEFRKLGLPLPRSVKVAAVYGGVEIAPQIDKLRSGVDVLVATPGRLLDLARQNAVDLQGAKALVLDEADRMLDLGFADELEQVLTLMPAERQNLFFSATFPDAVQALAQRLLREPQRIAVSAEPHLQPDIELRAIAVDPSRRAQLLRHLIEHNPWSRILVFVATTHTAEMLAGKLRRAHIYAEAFYGALTQGKRTQVWSDFKASRLKVLVATDVAARGLDVAHLAVVVNFDLPRSAVDFTHRIGRTARAGQSGLAISFVSADTERHFRLIAKRYGLAGDLEIVEGFEPQETQAAPPPLGFDPSTGGIKGKRPSKKDKLRAAAAAAVQANPPVNHPDNSADID